MDPRLVLVVIPVLLSVTSSALGVTQSQQLAQTDVEGSEPTVSVSLGQVWQRFGDLATSLYKISLVTDNSEGRGSKMARMTIPLIIGFKVTGAIIAALVALKVIILKTVVLSGVALLVSLTVGAKYLHDKLQKHHHEHEPTPVYIVPQIKDVHWGGEYEVQTGHSEVYPSHGSPDLQGHYSEIVPQTTDENQTAAPYIVVPDAQRKTFKEHPKYRTTIYKTKYKMDI